MLHRRLLAVCKVDAGCVEDIVPSGVRWGDDASWAVWDDYDVAQRLGGVRRPLARVAPVDGSMGGARFKSSRGHSAIGRGEI